MKDKKFMKNLEKYFKGRTDVSTKELSAFIKRQEPSLPDKTVSWKIHLLKEAGVLAHVNRGRYSFGDNKPLFQPPISEQLKNIYTQIKKELPYINISIWDTRWLNSFMIHQIGRFDVIIETEKDAMDPVFNLLSEKNKNVFVNPDKKTLERYSGNYNESIIIMPLITEAPTISANGIITASIEKILVDCLVETELFSAQQEELDNIFKTAFEKFSINIHRASRYARRRDHLKELENMLKELNQTSAKK